MSVKDFFRDLLYLRKTLIICLTPLLLLPLPLVEKRSEAQCAYVVIIMAVFWVTEALPIAVTALLPVFLFPVVGLMSVKETSQEYMNDTNMLFVGGLIVAAAIEHWNIHRRIALTVLLKFGSNPRWLMLGLMIPTWFLSMWISNTATAAMVLPIATYVQLMLGLMIPTWFLSMWISNTATTAMMIPIANAILVQLRDTKKAFSTGEVNNAAELDDLEMEIKVPPATETNGYPVKISDTEKQADNTDLANDTPTENTDPGINAKHAQSEEDDPGFQRLCKCISLSIAYAANCGGIGSLTGTGPNLVLRGQLDIVYEEYGLVSPVTFANWLGFGVPTSLVLMFLVWIWLQIYFLRCGGLGSNKEQEARVEHVIRVEYDKLGEITFAQAAVGVHFVVLALLWITRDLGGEYGWGSLFKDGYTKDAVPAVIVGCLLFIFPQEIPPVFCRRPTGYRSAYEPLMTWQAVEKKIPWGVMFLLGGGFAMAKASQVSGLSEWVGDKLAVLDYLQPWVLNLVLCYIAAAMTEVTSNTAICTLLMPILANLAVQLKQNPMYLMLPTAVATSFAFMLPVATPPNAVVFSHGYVRVIDMARAGFVLNILCVLVLIGSTETLGNHLFDLHTIPEEILKTYNTTA